MKSIREKNKEQDFRDLENAVRHMQDYLRSDEAHPDLYDQFPFRTDIGGCHRYYLEPYRSTFGSMLEKGPFIPFPSEIMQKYERVECASFMGIIPEINRVWITIDNQLYLWNYYQPEDYQVYDGITEVIVSVALTVPKPGIFLDSVKYLLVVATPVDIVLLAICADDAFDQIKIVPTAYTLPSDNVTMIKIVGSELGRILMIGNDKNLYELDYTISESTWAPILGTGPQRKCAKINHFAWNWKLNSIIPPIFRSQRDLLDEFTDICLDNSRNIVYTITLGGELNGFYLYQPSPTPSNSTSGTPSSSSSPSSNIDFFLNSFNLFDECRRYCTSSRFAPQSSPHASLFNDPFSSDGFIPIAMYPIPFTESKKAHLLVILKNGIRIYLSLIFYRYEVDHSPRGIEVSYIRNPPSPEILDVASNPTLPPTANVENGSLPSLHLNRQLSLGKTFASKGVFLFAVEKNQQPDELFGIFEDSMKRDHSVATNTTHHHASQSFSLKEGISYALGSNVSGAKVYDMKEVSSKYYNYSLSKLKSLFYQSSSPSDMNIRDQTHHHYPNIIQHAGGQSRGGAGWLGSFFADKTPSNDDDNMNREVSAVLTDSNALVLRSVATRAGVERIDAQNLAMLSEQAAQHLPTHSYCTQRQILVLTSNGLQVLLKLRPADILFRCLIQHDSRTDDYVREFFTTYGSLPASLMCLGLALGLPVDACGSRFVNPIQPLEFAPTVPLKTIQVRAMRAMFALNPGPSYRAALPSVTGGALHTAADNRVVVVGNTHEFQKSISHDAFYWMASRLLRPIWFRAIFDPRTEELLSDVWTLFLLQELRKPIEYLVELLVTYYPSAVSSPVDQAQSSSSVSQAAKMMEGLDATNGSTTFITQQIAEQARQHHPNLEKSLFQRAKQLEDSSIRNLYLLLTRVLQGFSVLEIFVRSIEDWKLPHAILKELISSLKGYSFRSLVLLPKIQDICKKQLYHLITHLLTSNKIELAEIILEQLKEQGYYYFSSGDVYYIEGNKLFTLLKMKSILPDYQGYFSTGSTVLLASTSSTSSSSEIMKYVEQCCDYYLKASEFWNSIENLSNTNNESELKQTCNALLFLGRLGWESIVNICLSTASKFSSIQSADTYQLSNKQYSKHHQLFPTSPVPTSATALTTVNDGNSVTTKESLTLMRDFHLFHGGMMLSETMKQDYQRHCYEILIDQILFTETNLHSVYDFHQYQQLPNNYAEQISQFLLTYSLQKCSDLRYHELLYSKLYSMKEKGHQHRLLSITSPYIEQFLRERDPELLYVYYMSTEFPRSPEYLKAIDLMCGIASDPSELPIEYRIECIEKALTSAMIAYQTLTNQSSSVSNSIGNKTMFTATQSLESYLLDNIQQFKDMIAVAKYQERIGKSLLQDYERYGTVDEAASLRDRYDEKTLRELDIMKEFIHQLQFQLVNLTTLYEIAFRYRMWKFNLLILQLSKQTDVELIQKLWKSYIYRMVPLKARYSEVIQFLDSQRRDTSKLIIDPRNQESRYQFEEYTLWLPNLFQQVLGLGKEILSHENKLLPNKSAADTASNYLLESSVYFPIITVIEEMEEILSYIRIPSISSTSNSSSQLFGSSSAAATEEKESIVPIQLLQEFRQHYSFGYQLIHHLQLSSSIIIEYYLQIFLRWKSKTYDKLLQLLMIIIYLLLEWIRTSNEEVNNNQYTEDNWYCITMIRQGKLDKWLEILRSQLLSIQYRQIKESFSPFIEQLMTEMNQIQKYKETLTIYTKITK